MSIKKLIKKENKDNEILKKIYREEMIDDTSTFEKDELEGMSDVKLRDLYNSMETEDVLDENSDEIYETLKKI